MGGVRRGGATQMRHVLGKLSQLKRELHARKIRKKREQQGGQKKEGGGGGISI